MRIANLLFLFLISISGYLNAQNTTIFGKVLDTSGLPIMGANIYLEGTYDGTSSDENGNFHFTTSVNGIKTLIVSFISFENYNKTSKVSEFKNIIVTMKEDVNTLDAVTINAGTFEAGDNAKVTALKPLDVVTTARALGDFVGALQT